MVEDSFLIFLRREKHAIDFKKKLGENSKQSIKIDKLGRFKVRFLIDKTTIKYSK